MDDAEASQSCAFNANPGGVVLTQNWPREVGHSHRFELTVLCGRWSQSHVRVYWDDGPRSAGRVIASIDDGGWRGYDPLTNSSILGPMEHSLANSPYIFCQIVKGVETAAPIRGELAVDMFAGTRFSDVEYCCPANAENIVQKKVILKYEDDCAALADNDPAACSGNRRRAAA